VATVAVGVSCAGPGGPPRDLDYPAPAEDLAGAAAGLLSRAIQFDTTNPPGDERPLAEWLAEVLEREGVESRVVPLPDASSRRAAVWARVRGSGRERPVVLLSHLDVVPAEADEWTVDPFAGVVGGGYVVGRGALDAKGVTVSHLLTLVRLLQRGAPLARDVILLATPDEETGGREGAALVARDHPELLDGAEYLLTEGGGILPGTGDEPDVWGVAFTEKTPCWVELRARGLPGHGSTATAEAATPRLLRALRAIEGLEGGVKVVPEVAEMFAAMARFAPAADRRHYLELRGALALNPAFRERFLADAGRAALVRNTAMVTMLSGSDRINVMPSEARAGIDVRLLPGESCPAFVERVRRAIHDPGVEVDVALSFEAAASPTRSPLLDAIARVAERSDPPGVMIPRVIAGFTDAHWFRELGIDSYGFVPRRLRPVESRGIHGPNERIAVDTLVDSVELMIAILEELE
jgi:acetylornithine deacetylase/succinyl-diaminopimelate desuccinylase-like protein